MWHNKKMINFDDVTKENIKENNPSWPQIPDPYKILIIGGSGSGKRNSNKSSTLYYIDEICLHAKNSYEAKYWFLIKKRDGTGLKHLNDSKDFYWTLKWYGSYL